MAATVTINASELLKESEGAACSLLSVSGLAAAAAAALRFLIPVSCFSVFSVDVGVLVLVLVVAQHRTMGFAI